MSKRTFKEDKLAKVYDTEVVPIWSRRFGKMLLRDLTVPPKAMVLDVNCGSGYPSLDILRKMDEAGRIIAIDTSSPLLDEARNKAGKLSGKRIFFRSEAGLPKLPFAEEVYDLVFGNAGLQQLDDPEPAVRECARVTKVGGRFIATYPLAGTFGEFYDIFREVLIKGDYKDALDRLDAYLTRYPPLEQAIAWFEDAGFTDIESEFESFTLLFKSSREFFFAPMIEYGPLSSWKAIAGKGQQMQDVFWQTKAAIDAYFAGSAFSVTVNAGCVRGRKIAREAVVQVPAEPPPAEPMKGARASSSPKRASTSRPSGPNAAGEAPELPDAPSDEVDALSGSWPVPVPEPQRDPSGTGSSAPKWEIADLRAEAEAAAALGVPPPDEPLVGDFVDEIPTVTRDGWPSSRPQGEAVPRGAAFPRVAEPQPPHAARSEDGDEHADIDADDIVESRPAHEHSEVVELGTGDVVMPDERPEDEDLSDDADGIAPETSGTGEVQLGTAEIEVIEGSVSVTATAGAKGKRKRVVKRDTPENPADDPDDDIL